jgi:hypothetical protein
LNVHNKLRLAAEMLDKPELLQKELPPSFLLPWVEAAKDVDAPELNVMFARLLASAADDEPGRHPALMDAVRRMNVDDARLLQSPKDIPPNELALKVAWLATATPADLAAGRLEALRVLQSYRVLPAALGCDSRPSTRRSSDRACSRRSATN